MADQEITSPTWEPFIRGVQIRRSSTGSVTWFRGSGDALIEAGLLTRAHLPGLPGSNRKQLCTVFWDGSMPRGAPTANYRQRFRWEPSSRASTAGFPPGMKQIRKTGKDRFEVTAWPPAPEDA